MRKKPNSGNAPRAYPPVPPAPPLPSLTGSGSAPRRRIAARAAVHRGAGRVVHSCGDERRVSLRGRSAWDIPGARLREQKLGKAQVHERPGRKAPPGL